MSGLLSTVMGGGAHHEKRMKELSTKHAKEVASLERKNKTTEGEMERYRSASVALSELVQKLWMRIIALVCIVYACAWRGFMIITPLVLQGIFIHPWLCSCSTFTSN